MRFVVFGWAVIVCMGTSYTEDDGVIVLNDATFNDALTELDLVLVAFYAPWCGHCQRLLPEYAKAAKQLTNSHVRLAKIDVSSSPDLKATYNVQSYPTIIWFDNSSPIEYTGGRTDRKILKWIREIAGTVVKRFEWERDTAMAFVRKHRIAVLFFGDEGSSEYRVFARAIRGYRTAIYGLGDDEARIHFEVSLPSLIIVDYQAGFRLDYQGDLNSPTEIKAFLEEHQTPAILPFDDALIESVFQRQQPALFLFCSNSDPAFAELSAVASELRGRILVT
jgi:protein disulfide-isomerase-like protein